MSTNSKIAADQAANPARCSRLKGSVIESKSLKMVAMIINRIRKLASWRRLMLLKATMSVYALVECRAKIIFQSTLELYA